jgi:CheY-like chemotaxis protein
MVGGRPREIFPRSYPVAPIRCPASAVAALCAEAVGRLASIAREDEVLTIAGYLIDKHVYLDLSRHGREQPAIEQIGRFGEYTWAGELADQLTATEFLTPVIGQPCLVCLDQRAAQFSYMSFKFPISEQPSLPARWSPGRLRLLAIDDQTVILDLITAMCQSLDYEIKTARAGTEGLKLAEQYEFDIILADLAMPGASGLEVARRLKEIAPGVPVILVTGWEVTLQPEQLQAAGIVRVLHKPFRIEQLTEIVRSVTANRTVG